MNVLVIGSGGREHAIIWAIKKSPIASEIYACPGNGGTAKIAQNVLLNINSAEEVKEFCDEKKIGFVIIGPEAPLVDGLADELERLGIMTLGPGKGAAQLEGSKAFTKYICKKYNIPTADYEEFTDADSAKAYINKNEKLPIVIKADGLAAGKGVVIANTNEEALQAVEDMLVAKQFGNAGSKIVIEEFLNGEELSFFALADEVTAIPFGSAQDHKRVGEKDTGVNTGGMGTYSPAPVLNDELHAKIMEEIIYPLILGMNDEGLPYRGVVFAGLMIENNQPKLLEINVRFGDPETQCLMARLDSDLLDLLMATARGDLIGKEVVMKDEAALCVVMAANGYPGGYEKGSEIKNLDECAKLDNTIVFHAGTMISSDDKYIANGGRVLGVTALGSSVTEAQKNAYKAVDTIDWPEGFCRRDIGWRAVEREKSNAA